ncbi:MAG: DUF3828 domain-containing protein [Acidobacteriota bacterium]
MRVKTVLLLLTLCCNFSFTLNAGQSAKPAASPDATVKEFYRWYIEQLSKNIDPLSQKKSTMAKYLTPELLRKAPRLIEQMDADIFINAQDFDEAWGKHVMIAKLMIQGAKATMNVTLKGSPSFGDSKMRIHMKQIAGVWKIDRIDPL